MAMRLTIQQFLQTTKQLFLSAVELAQPVTVVAGNSSADLDSFASSILYAYLESNIPTTLADHPVKSVPRPLIPLLNIPRSEVSLRPELLYLANQLAFHSNDLFCLDDIPNSLSPSQTSFVLVDHNVLQGDLGSKFSSRISAIIDHHADEGTAPTSKPRIITTSGSCCSLVSEHFRDGWDALHLPANINAQLAKLALGPILVDTSNLQHRVTPADVAAVTHLVSKCQSVSSLSSSITDTADTHKFSRDDFYHNLQRAKLAIDHMTLPNLLKKDYKEWTDPSNKIKLGISSIPKPLLWVVQHESNNDNDDNKQSSFFTSLENWSKERHLDVIAIMTTNAGEENQEFTRDLFVWGIAEEAKNLKTRLIELEKDNEELGLEKWEGENKFKIEDKDRQAWRQKRVEKSRKQVAPYLREVISKL